MSAVLAERLLKFDFAEFVCPQCGGELEAELDLVALVLDIRCREQASESDQGDHPCLRLQLRSRRSADR